MSDTLRCARCPMRRRHWDDEDDWDPRPDPSRGLAEFERRCAYCGLDILLCEVCLADTFLCERCFGDVRMYGKEVARRRGRRRERQRKPWGRRRPHEVSIGDFQQALF